MTNTCSIRTCLVGQLVYLLISLHRESVPQLPRTATLVYKVLLSLVNARLALCLASDGVLSLPIRVTMVALRSNSFCQRNAGTQETDFSVALLLVVFNSSFTFQSSHSFTNEIVV